MEVRVPPAANLGASISLSCTYHLQGEPLYTVKLYKGRHEFLQLVPENDPPLKTFPRKGLNIKVRATSKRSRFDHLEDEMLNLRFS